MNFGFEIRKQGYYPQLFWQVWIHVGILPLGTGPLLSARAWPRHVHGSVTLRYQSFSLTDPPVDKIRFRFGGLSVICGRNEGAAIFLGGHQGGMVLGMPTISSNECYWFCKESISHFRCGPHSWQTQSYVGLGMNLHLLCTSCLSRSLLSRPTVEQLAYQTNSNRYNRIYIFEAVALPGQLI